MKFPLSGVPKTWEEMSVPEIYRMTARNDRFLAVEERVEPGRQEKILIFCSNAQKDLLTGADYWVADGTFEVVSNTLFYQLFIVHAISPLGITVPCLYAFLPDKELTTYQRIFDFLKSDGVLPPKSLKTDFEKGIVRGFLNVYAGVPVTGCNTHFKRTIRRKLTSTEIGLASLYSRNEALQTLVRYTWGLSMVPIDEIIPLWEEFIRVEYEKMTDGDSFEGENDAVDEWLGYFERAFIGALNWRTGNRKQPMYPHAMWNKNREILSDDATTTNAAEGYNGAIKGSLPRNNTIWTLIKLLRKEESLNMIKLRDVALGKENNVSTAPNTSRNLSKDQRRHDLKNLVAQFESMATNLFMDALIDFYNDIS